MANTSGKGIRGIRTHRATLPFERPNDEHEFTLHGDWPGRSDAHGAFEFVALDLQHEVSLHEPIHTIREAVDALRLQLEVQTRDLWQALDGISSSQSAYVDIVAAMIPQMQRPSQQEIEKIFNEAAVEWRENTRGMSWARDLASDPSYLRIIGLGELALPLILQELADHPAEQWFVALQSIARIDPVRTEDRGRRPRMREAWLAWGREIGLI